MNQYKKHLLDNKLQKELIEFGFHIETPRHTRHKLTQKNDLISYDGCPCQLLDLIEVSNNKELWQVKFLDELEPSFILI